MATKSSRPVRKRQWKEVTIPLLHGNIAAKWWAPYNVQPIIAIHGWQDNAGTFDTLIPLLPDHVGYLAIDLPGHGLSDRLPDGTMYGYLQYVYHLHQLVIKLKLSKVTVLGHSMGAIVAFLFASAFPDRCTAIIALDAVKIMSITGPYLMQSLRNFDEIIIADRRNQLGEASKPPSFTYAEMVAKMRSPTPMLDVSPEFAPFLLERGICATAVANGEIQRFHFTRDSRLKFFHLALFSQEMCLQLAERITCPHLYIRTDNGFNLDNNLHINETLEVFGKNLLFECICVPGGHHVHLENASVVSGKISQFIRKYTNDTNQPTIDCCAVHKL